MLIQKMNTIELANVMSKLIRNGQFLGVFPSDLLPRERCSVPLSLIVNTDPSNKPGQHWVAIHVFKDRTGYFFDSFGNPPDSNLFPASIMNFFKTNCTFVSSSARAVQSRTSDACGHHCVFFLYNVSRGRSYQCLMKMYSVNNEQNDRRAMRFVNCLKKSVRPYVTNVSCNQACSIVNKCFCE